MHRRDLKLIDSDVKIAELYAELRAMGKRDAHHCMPAKEIPDLQWKTPEETTTKSDPENKTPQQNGPVLRSSKRKAPVAEIVEKTEEVQVEDKREITSKFLTVAVTTTAAMLYTAACKLIETNLF